MKNNCKKDYINYLIYTDYYRITGINYNLKEKIKLFFFPGQGGIKGFKLIKCLRKVQGSDGLIRFFRTRYYFKLANSFGVEIPLNVSIGKGFIIWHTQGIVLHENTIIGDNCAILHQVTMGNSYKNPTYAPKIGSGAIIGAGAKIIGPVSVGDYVTVGANAVVTHDLPDYCTAAGIPARILRIRESGFVGNIDYLSYDEWKKNKHLFHL